MTDKLAKRDETSLAPLTPDEIVEQVTLIQNIMKKTMLENVHYGIIPGCGDKPTLLKPGAEKLSLTFRMAPKYDITINNLTNGHREYEIVCNLYHITTGDFLGSGVGVCSTMESKYRYRNQNRICPECDKEAIIKGKEQYGGGWLCFKKKGGCGTKWDNGAGIIESQSVGKTEYEDPADYYNTVKKMGKKRAHVDAVLTATAASDIFTQDIEEPHLTGDVIEGEVVDSCLNGGDTKSPSKGEGAVTPSPPPPNYTHQENPKDKSRVEWDKLKEKKGKGAKKEFLDFMDEQKKRIGDDAFYMILNRHKYKEATEIAKYEVKVAIYREMLDMPNTEGKELNFND